jgi:hypothetical protein
MGLQRVRKMLLGAGGWMLDAGGWRLDAVLKNSEN